MLGFFLVLGLVVAIPLTINVLVNGADAVINLSPRDGSAVIVKPAFVPCLLVWFVNLLLIAGIRSALRSR